MSITVPESFKPSGGFVPPQAEQPVQAPPVADRTVTFPLCYGGFLTVECPEWCTADHSRDIETGLVLPSDLMHQGDEVALELPTVDGPAARLLAGRITQYPFCADADGSERPHIALEPAEGTGDDMGYLTAAEVNETITLVRAHLAKLQELAEQLAQAAAVRHEMVFAGRSDRWRMLLSDDVKTMPVGYLLEAFSARVVEGDSVEGWATMTADGDGFVIILDRVLSQHLREYHVRQLLLAKLGGRS